MYVIETNVGEIITKLFPAMEDVNAYLKDKGCKAPLVSTGEPGTMVAHWEAEDGTDYAVWHLPVVGDSLEGRLVRVAAALDDARLLLSDNEDFFGSVDISAPMLMYERPRARTRENAVYSLISDSLKDLNNLGISR